MRTFANAMAKNPSELWAECSAVIRERLTDTQYRTFFEPVAVEQYDAKSRTLGLRAPNKQIVEYLEQRFLPLMVEAIAPRLGQVFLKYYIVNSSANGEAVTTGEGSEAETTKIATNLKPSYTFANYVEGDSNRLARSVGLTIAEHPRKTSFNPMFVYGPSGCGKTHLITAIGNRTCELFPKKKVLYVQARDFQKQYTMSVTENHFNEFIQFYQQFDMLIVDDIQEWQTQKTYEAFFHIFNHLFMSGKRIILAADRTPNELRPMDERMLTRFNCGMLAELEQPNFELCVAILRAKIKKDALVIPDNIVEYIARNANGSVRDLEGVINSLLAYSVFTTGEIDMTLAEKVVSRIKHEAPVRIDAQKVIQCVAQHYGISQSDIVGQARKHELVVARQIAMHLMQHVAKMNVNAIGRAVGGRNHATVLHSLRKIDAILATDKDLARDLKTITRNIKTN